MILLEKYDVSLVGGVPVRINDAPSRNGNFSWQYGLQLLPNFVLASASY